MLLLLFVLLVTLVNHMAVSENSRQKSLGARWAPTSSWWPFGPALGTSGLLDIVLRALWVLGPSDPRNGASNVWIVRHPTSSQENTEI